MELNVGYPLPFRTKPTKRKRFPSPYGKEVGTFALVCLVAVSQAYGKTNPFLAACLKEPKKRLFTDSDTLARKLITAVEKADVKQISKLAFCETRVGPWESETSPLLPKEVADYIAKSRKSPNPKELLPFKVIRREGNKKVFLLAVGGFQFGEPTVANDVRVLVLENTPQGWKWSWTIETNAQNVNDVFSSHLKP